MQLRRTSLILFCVIASLFACKKKDSDLPVTNTPVSKTVYYSGVLVAYRDSTSPNSVLEYCTADFYKDSTYLSKDTTASVSVNGRALIYEPLIKQYQLGGRQHLADSLRWNVVGYGTVPSITLAFDDPFPTFRDTTLPDSFRVQYGLALRFNSATVKNADSVLVQLSQSSGTYIRKTFAPNGTSASFRAEELAELVAGQPVELRIVPEKLNTQTVNGKQYLFIKQGSFSKRIYPR